VALPAEPQLHLSLLVNPTATDYKACMNPKEATKLANWVEKRQPKCPVCGSGDWQLSVVCELPIRADSHVVSALPLVCASCHYMMLVSASVLTAPA